MVSVILSSHTANHYTILKLKFSGFHEDDFRLHCSGWWRRV